LRCGGVASEMTPTPPRSAVRPWQRQLFTAMGCAAVGLLVHFAGSVVPVQLATIGLAVGVVGAAFILAWAADAGEAVFSGGFVLAAVALIAILPEFIVEIRFAYIQETELVSANLTGATRLLITGAIATPLALAYLAKRRGHAPGMVELAASRRLELAILLVAAIFAIQIIARGTLTVIDGVVLIALYVFYARQVQGTHGEEPAVVGVPAGLLTLPPQHVRLAITGLIVGAAAVVVTIANPFADALLATGTSLGMDPYLLIQTIVPAASEAPEFVIVAVLVANRRPAQGLALFLASSVSQWTLALGALPIAYLAGGGGMSLPLAGRELIELALTVSLTLFGVAALAVLRPTRFDAWFVVGVFAVQFLYPTPFVRIAATFVFLVFAIDLAVAHRRAVLPLFRTAFGGRRARAEVQPSSVDR
jgi:cation:H+ antiporter